MHPPCPGVPRCPSVGSSWICPAHTWRGPAQGPPDVGSALLRHVRALHWEGLLWTGLNLQFYKGIFGTESW